MAAMTISVRVGPGATVLTRMPAAPSSTAQVRVKDSTAALVALYVESPAMPTRAAMVLTLTTLPRPRSTIPGTTAAVRK